MKTASLAPLKERSSHIAPILRACANEQRIRILWRLADNRDGVPTVTLVLESKLSRSAISQHLAVLRRRGIVVPRKIGRNVFYRLADAKTAEFVVKLREVIAVSYGHDAS